jgi:WD40 repeat protein
MVLGEPGDGTYYVQDARTARVGTVDGSKVGPSFAPTPEDEVIWSSPAFATIPDGHRPWWVEATRASNLWSAATGGASFGPVKAGDRFITGSYDRTVRIWRVGAGKSREVYHAKRMQRVFAVRFTGDAKYVLSGSDDTNVRIWKASAADNLGVVSGRQERKERFNDTVKKLFAHMPEVKRVQRDKRVPKAIKKAVAIKHIQATSERRKQDNRKRHSRPEDVEIQPEKKRSVLKEFK